MGSRIDSAAYELLAEAWSYDQLNSENCPECMLPVDELDPDDPHCPWCGARNPEPLQSLVWAELQAVEEAWPEALESRA